MMQYYQMQVDSALGEIKIICTDAGLTAVSFEDKKVKCVDFVNDKHPILKQTKQWLEDYFAGKQPQLNIPLAPNGTNFQKMVWEILLKIPYGKIVSYKDIANIIAQKCEIASMSAQAVGGAVKNNPIAIIIPCHRVVGSNYSLTGYAGGLDKKIYLLNHEKVDISNYKEIKN